MAECIIKTVPLFSVYDSGQQIGVSCKPQDIYIPISFQGSIEDTYSLARITCEILGAFWVAHGKFPEGFDQFIEEVSRVLPREEYIQDLRLFLVNGWPKNCSDCRFLNADMTCKHTLPGVKCIITDYGCAGGIRKEQNNG